MTNKALQPIEDHQAPALFDPPKLDMFNRYKSELVAFEYDDYDQAGKPVIKSWPLEEIGPYTELIPKARCHTILKELEDALAPAGVDVGIELVERVIGLSRERHLIHITRMLRLAGSSRRPPWRVARHSGSLVPFPYAAAICLALDRAESLLDIPSKCSIFVLTDISQITPSS